MCAEEIHDEFESALQYVCQYISLSTMEHRAVLWHLFHAPIASEWLNALALVELLFSLLASNGVVKRVFSQVNVIKTKKRCSLSNELLDDLLTITSAHVPLTEMTPLIFGGKRRYVDQTRRQDDPTRNESVLAPVLVQLLLAQVLVLLLLAQQIPLNGCQQPQPLSLIQVLALMN